MMKSSKSLDLGQWSDIFACQYQSPSVRLVSADLADLSANHDLKKQDKLSLPLTNCILLNDHCTNYILLLNKANSCLYGMYSRNGWKGSSVFDTNFIHDAIYCLIPNILRNYSIRRSFNVIWIDATSCFCSELMAIKDFFQLFYI